MRHELLGEVEITVRTSARRFIARCGSDGRVCLTVPSSALESDVRRALDELAPRLLARRKQIQPLYSDGMVVDNPGLRVEIRHSARARGGVCVSGTTANAIVHIDPALSLADHDVTETVSRLMMRVAGLRARTVLVPQACAVAAELGVAPRKWIIGRGLRTLGRCSSRREISLSAALMYAPEHLRRYVICHELAHLSEMNHSARFHSLCNDYCGGLEAELEAALKAYRWPLLR